MSGERSEVDEDGGVYSLSARDKEGNEIGGLIAGCIRPARRIGTGADWGWLCNTCDEKHKEGIPNEWYSPDTFGTPEEALANFISHRKRDHAEINGRVRGVTEGASAKDD